MKKLVGSFMAFIGLMLVIGLGVMGSASAGAATTTLNLVWKAPAAREDGTVLLAGEISGYEIRYRKVGEDASANLTKPVTGGATLKTSIAGLVPSAAGYLVEIAAIDTSGTYSKFISFTETIKAKPGSPTPVSYTTLTR